MQRLTSDEWVCLLDGVPELALGQLQIYSKNWEDEVFKERKHMQSFSGIWNRLFWSIKSVISLTLRGLWHFLTTFPHDYFFSKIFLIGSKQTNKPNKKKWKRFTIFLNLFSVSLTVSKSWIYFDEVFCR